MSAEQVEDPKLRLFVLLLWEPGLEVRGFSKPDDLIDVDMSLDLSITGHCTLFPPRKNRSAYKFKAANSFVDETLFGSTGGKVDPALQWTAGTLGQGPILQRPEKDKETKSSTTGWTNGTPTGTPRKKTQYRVKCRSPSYCDESLFGQKLKDCGWEAPWVKKEDTIRIRPLLWSPPPIVRPQSSKPNTKQLPLRAVHPPDCRTSVLGAHEVKGNFWKPPEGDSDSGGCPSSADPRASAKARWSSPRRDTARSSCYSGRLTVRRGSGTEKPPWK
ncbi:RBPJ-interacting and tubulin-associated protein 1 [Mixophyes fleayi]|uniref:RBPJ-interacting and tubulin-associated protein 1 n=1 Tax=Mixophyes fleayi TaxID=3061075 RepID=UPI003F4DDEDE